MAIQLAKTVLSLWPPFGYTAVDTGIDMARPYIASQSGMGRPYAASEAGMMRLPTDTIERVARQATD